MQIRLRASHQVGRFQHQLNGLDCANLWLWQGALTDGLAQAAWGAAEAPWVKDFLVAVWQSL